MFDRFVLLWINVELHLHFTPLLSTGTRHVIFRILSETFSGTDRKSLTINPNSPGGTGIPQLFGDDRLLIAEVHKSLHDRVGMWHI